MTETRSPYFSIIIPCYNEENYVLDLLSDLENQRTEGFSFEVIVVDNGSQDRTFILVKDYASTSNLKVKVCQEPRKGVSRTRNTGARQSSGQFLVFFDADNRIDQDFLFELYKSLESFGHVSPVGMCTIRTLPSDGNIFDNFIFWSMEIIKRWGGRPFGKSIVSRTLWLTKGGFNEEIALGENIELLIRLKAACYLGTRRVHHFQRPLLCSMRRFRKAGYLKVLPLWLFAYFGMWKFEYETIDEIDRAAGSL